MVERLTELLVEETVLIVSKFPSVSTSIWQVLSLNQFYFVDFSHSRISVKSELSTNAQSRFALAVLGSVLETSVPSTSHLTVSWYLFSSGSSA